LVREGGEVIDDVRGDVHHFEAGVLVSSSGTLGWASFPL